MANSSYSERESTALRRKPCALAAVAWLACGFAWSALPASAAAQTPNAHAAQPKPAPGAAAAQARAASPATPPANTAPASPPPCTKANLVAMSFLSGPGLDGIPRTVQDGTLAPEGEVWNSGFAVVLHNPGGELVIDLHDVHELRYLVLQGDNNDYYSVEGSVDGHGYSAIWTADPMMVGFGLRTRSVALKQAASARYLRVRGSGGDGYYSLSEVRAYCDRPATWPPAVIVPPKQYGWHAIDNDGMVAIKGWAALAGTLLLLLLAMPKPRVPWLASAPKWLRIGLDVATGLAILLAVFVWFNPFGLPFLPFVQPGSMALVAAIVLVQLLILFATLHQRGARLTLLLDVLTAALTLLVVLAFWNPMHWKFQHGEPTIATFALIGALLARLLPYALPFLRKLGVVPRRVLDVLLALSCLVMLFTFFDPPQIDLGPFKIFAYWNSLVPHTKTALLSSSTISFCAVLTLRLLTELAFDETLLALMGVFAFLSWWNLGHFHFDHYEHTWEHYHYYMGAKYGPELRYARLYECTAVADLEDGLRARVKKREMRDLAVSNELGPSDAIINNPLRCTSHFTPERWKAFRDDIRFFRTKFSSERWDESQTDHGYNGTPVWAVLGRLIADYGDITWRKLQTMAWIDSVLLVVMWGASLWAFGWRATSVALMWWGFNFPARFYWNGGSFLRYDWMLWMVVGICLLKKRYHFAAGAALTYSTLLRVFPGFIVAAIILKALARMVRLRRLVLSRGHLHFAAGCIVAMLVLIPASGWATHGLDAWKEFAYNSKKHLSTALTNNMGLKTALGYDDDTRAERMRDGALHDPFATWKDAREYFYAKRQPILYALLILFCVILARAGDREPDWAAACLGAGLIAMAAELTCYYYTFFLTYGLLWSRRKYPGIVATAVAGLTCYLYFLFDWNDVHFAGMSLAITLMVVGVTAMIGFGPGVQAEAEPEPEDLPAPRPTPRVPPEAATSSA